MRLRDVQRGCAYAAACGREPRDSLHTMGAGCIAGMMAPPSAATFLVEPFASAIQANGETAVVQHHEWTCCGYTCIQGVRTIPWFAACYGGRRFLWNAGRRLEKGRLRCFVLIAEASFPMVPSSAVIAESRLERRARRQRRPRSRRRRACPPRHPRACRLPLRPISTSPRHSIARSPRRGSMSRAA